MAMNKRDYQKMGLEDGLFGVTNSKAPSSGWQHAAYLEGFTQGADMRADSIAAEKERKKHADRMKAVEVYKTAPESILPRLKATKSVSQGASSGVVRRQRRVNSIVNAIERKHELARDARRLTPQRRF